MPKTTKEKAVFGIIMSVTMAYGMELYNLTLNARGFSVWLLVGALKELSFMWIFVFITSNLWGNKFGGILASKFLSDDSDRRVQILVRSLCTVVIMCPTMSLIASVLFQLILAHQSIYDLPLIWMRTVLRNIPMAAAWNLIVAGPATRGIFSALFRKKQPA